MTGKTNPWDIIDNTNVEAVAKRLRPLGYGERETTVPLEDRIAVCRMMSTDLTLKANSRWEGTTTDTAPWRRVKHTEQWDEIGDLMHGEDFRGCLARALDCGGTGYWEGATQGTAPWTATADEIIEATRARIVESDEDGLIPPEDEAILNLPPVMIVAIHLRMEGYFLDRVRGTPDLLIGGSIESIQRDTAKRWGKVIDCIIETLKVLEVAGA